MLDLLLGDLTGYMIAAVGVVVSLIAVYFKGRGDQKQKTYRDSLEAWRDTRERMDDVEVFEDSGVARDFLADRLRSRK